MTDQNTGGDEPHPFEPDWTIHPGVFLRRMLEERNITGDELAIHSRIGFAAVQEIIDGKAPVDQVTAERLHAVLGTGIPFWVNAQAQYDADIARGATDTSEEHQNG